MRRHWNIYDIEYNNMWAHFYSALINKSIGKRNEANAALWRAVVLMDIRDAGDVFNYLHILDMKNHRDIRDKFKQMINNKIQLTRYSDEHKLCNII